MTDTDTELDPQALFDNLDARNSGKSVPEDNPAPELETEPEVETTAEDAPAPEVVDPAPETVEDTPADPAPETQAAPKGMVPSGVHRELGERARTAEAERDELKAQLERQNAETKAQLEQLQQLFVQGQRQQQPQAQEDAVDPFELVPELRPVIEQMQAQHRQDLETMRVDTSLQAARRVHGDEKYAQAYDFVKGDPTLRAKVLSAADPGETMMAAYDQHSTLQAIGGDLNAYQSSLLSDPAFLAKAVAAAAQHAPTTDAQGRPYVNVNTAPDVVNTGTRAAETAPAGEQFLTGQALFNDLDRRNRGDR